MSKQAADIDWQIVESDADWERLPAPTPVETGPITNRHPFLQRYLWCVAALLLVIVSVESRGWSTDQATLPARAVTAAAQR